MTVVITNSVKVSEGFEASDYDVHKLKPILERQGLIEPLKLDRNSEIGRIDSYDPARLEACKQLNWPTVITAPDSEDPNF